METEPPPETRCPPPAERPDVEADAWISELDELRRDYEAGMAYAGRFARRLAAAIYAESVRAHTSSSVETEDEEENLRFMA